MARDRESGDGGVTFFRLDVSVYRNKKILSLGKTPRARVARDLYIAMLDYSREQLTDGVIPSHVIGDLDPMTNPNDALKALIDLLSARLVKRLRGGTKDFHSYLIPDYAEHQQTKEEIEHSRKQAKERKRLQREKDRAEAAVTAASQRDLSLVTDLSRITK